MPGGKRENPFGRANNQPDNRIESASFNVTGKGSAAMDKQAP